MDFKDFGFEIEKTKDDSPTLRMIDGTERGGESMHHTGGAFSETQYIYAGGFRWGFQLPKPKMLSIGLGLGYVETLAGTLAAQYHHPNWEMDSFEVVKELRDNFENFYLGRPSHPVYEEILSRTARLYDVDPDRVKVHIRKALEEGRLRLHGDLLGFPLGENQYHVICHDAFSRKTNPDLWNETFLERLLKSCHEQESVVSTYACMGPLKRALKSHQFQVEIREGFHGKRNCTRALRTQSSFVVENLESRRA